MNRNNRIRLRLIILAREYKRSARKLKHEGFEDGSKQLKAIAEAYQHSAWIVKFLS